MAEDSGQRHALFNYGLSEGEDVCRAFLQTPEFRKEILERLVRRHVDKNTLADDAARRAMSDDAFASAIVLEFCKQSRQWLTFRRAKLTKPAPLGGTASDLLKAFGSGGWYGPFKENDHEHWWIYCQIAGHHHVVSREGDATHTQRLSARWHLVAKVTGECVSIHWNNFTYHETSEDAVEKHFKQFPYWHYAPGALSSIAERYGAELDESTDLHTFILHTLYDRYPQSSSVSWQHLKVRGVKEGVSVNASGREERVASGVQKLTRSLARAALTELGLSLDDENIRRLDHVFVRTVLREWGLKSYGFSVKTTDNRSIRAHCYFGTDKDVDGPDCFPHLLCYKAHGGSFAALEFLLAELRG